jgi:hypothetical protein
MARRSNSPKPKPIPSEVKELLPFPSIDELIAEARALGEYEMAEAGELIRYLEAPKRKRILEQEERRLSRL